MEIASSQWDVTRKPSYRSHVTHLPVTRNQYVPATIYARVYKRLIDLVVSSLLILSVLSWLTPLLFILIKLSSKGPLFFVQLRTGLEGRPFPCIKFRTMRINGDSHILQAQGDDDRITGIGRFLRITHKIGKS